ncbi:MAG: hypothetical protein U0K92_07570 [Treponema sp.]|nr:hypothetical protein [Treponema sp.]
MKHFTEYNGHIPVLIGQRKPIDNTIMTFDIETTSYLILDGKQIPACDYLKLSKDEQDRAIYQSCMYIWMFSIDGIVYYGRTWSELDSFLYRIQYFADSGKNIKHIVYVHNLPFEFQAMRNYFEFDEVFARKSRKPMRFKLTKYNFEFRDTLIMTNAKLEKLPELYLLNTQKLVGDLDYDLIRNSKTPLTEKEMQYCENDCIILHEYIQKELNRYDNFKKIPMTQTGQVRKELKEVANKSWSYLWKTRKSISADGHIFNLLTEAFMRGIHTFELDKNKQDY